MIPLVVFDRLGWAGYDARTMSDGERRYEQDTSIGGRRVSFPVTPGSAVLGVRSDDPVSRARAFTALVRAYWKPVYKRIRMRYKKTNEEAKDLTQAFFTRAFERGVFETYQPEGARFRTYVRRCLDNFVSNREQARQALKRGGGAIPLSLHYDEAELELAKAGEVQGAPEERDFDQDWVKGLFDASIEALRDRYVETGREQSFRAFERYDLVEEEQRPTYAELAEQLGVRATDITNYLHSTRKALRGLVLERLREITATDAEFRSEAIEVLGIDPDEGGS